MMRCLLCAYHFLFLLFFQAEDGIRDTSVTGVQTCALPISEQWALYGPFPSHCCSRPRACLCVVKSITSEGVIYRGNPSDLQHFLLSGRQDLHITTCGSLGFYLVFAYIQLWSPICTLLGWRKR